jgi:phosphoglycolate phosphatase
MQTRSLPAAVLFDLDGTLADTAHDLVAPVQAMRIERGLEPLPFETLRPYASMGARGLILRGLGVEREHDSFAGLRDEFLSRYEQAMLVRTRLFDGVDQVLASLDSAGIRWGVVSNKAERYVRPILRGLGIIERSVCVIGGDTTPHPKPHPAPCSTARSWLGLILHTAFMSAMIFATSRPDEPQT